MRSFMESRGILARGWRGRASRLIAALVFAGVAVAACDDSSGPQQLETLTITPLSATLAAGGTQLFTVTGTDTDGNAVRIDGETWAVVAGGGTIGATTGLFTAGTVAGTFTNTVRVTCNGITAFATVIVTPGAAASIVVAPDTTLLVGATAQFRAVIRDANGNILTIAPVWSTTNPPGTIVAATGLFTAGSTLGSFPNSVQGCIPSTTICDQANVTVIAAPVAPPPSGGFTVLGRTAVTCSLGSITPGDVGTFQAAGDAPPGTITASCIPVTSPGTVHAPGDAATKTAYNNFLAAYIARTPQPGDCDATHTLTGSLAGVTLAPGVWCFSAGAALTGTLTLNGPSTGIWLFKIGTNGTGGLTTTNFTVIMAGAALACNVTWWVRDAASMTDSFLKGTVMAGTGVTVTNGTFNGNMWAGASGTGDATETGAAITGCP
jgi:hypothetical protein